MALNRVSFILCTMKRYNGYIHEKAEGYYMGGHRCCIGAVAYNQRCGSKERGFVYITFASGGGGRSG